MGRRLSSGLSVPEHEDPTWSVESTANRTGVDFRSAKEQLPQRCERAFRS
jgi:hypothetical protein